MPEVSVIIPTYNRAHLIKRAIRSVLNQTYQSLEAIVVDDGSTDNTEEIVKIFNDDRIRYVRHKENRGYPKALNTGIKIARGQYIAFQDSDDEWLPEKLKKQMKVFETAPSEVGIVYTGFWKVINNKKIYLPPPWVRQKEGDIHNELIRGNFVGTPTTIGRKECFKKVGMFDENLPQFQDWELWIRISKYYQFRYIDEPLVISYYTPGGVNEQSGFIQAKTLKLILEKHFEDIKKDRKLLGKHYCSIGVLLCSDRELGRGRNYFIKAIKAHPLTIKFLLLIFISFFGQSVYDKAVKIYRRIKNY